MKKYKNRAKGIKKEASLLRLLFLLKKPLPQPRVWVTNPKRPVPRQVLRAERLLFTEPCTSSQLGCKSRQS